MFFFLQTRIKFAPHIKSFAACLLSNVFHRFKVSVSKFARVRRTLESPARSRVSWGASLHFCCKAGVLFVNSRVYVQPHHPLFRSPNNSQHKHRERTCNSPVALVVSQKKAKHTKGEQNKTTLGENIIFISSFIHRTSA